MSNMRGGTTNLSKRKIWNGYENAQRLDVQKMSNNDLATRMAAL